MYLRRFVLSVIIVITLLMAVSVALTSVANAKESEWQSISDSGTTLEFQPESEEIAHKLLPELVKLANGADNALPAATGKDLDQVASKRLECLNYIASKIGLSKPGKHMTKMYDDVLNAQRQLISEFICLNRFRLWSRDSLMDALRRGEHVPGFEYDALRDDLIYDFNVTTNVKSQTALSRFQLVYDPGESWFAVIQHTKEALGFYGQDIQEVTQPFVAFHESAEVGIMLDVGINTAYRRWFCDGVAQWVAEMATKQFVGQSEYERLVSLYSAYTTPSMKSHVDLLAWRGVEYEVAMPSTPGVVFNHAHYGFAVQEIRGLAERHGTDVMSKVMKNLSKRPMKDRNSGVILSAIKSVTGEDMAAALAQYGQQTNDPFRGVAIANVKCYLVGVGKHTSIKPMELASETPIKLDGRHDIRVEFFYEVLDHPATMLLSLSDLDGFRNIDVKLDGKGSSKMSKCLGLPEYVGAAESGTYNLQIIINGAVFAQKTVTLVQQENL